MNTVWLLWFEEHRNVRFSLIIWRADDLAWFRARPSQYAGFPLETHSARRLCLGALIPLFWGVAGMVLFNVPEGALSVLFWKAVYLTCPFWVIEGYKSLFLMPLLNGLLYACLAVLVMSVPRLMRR